MIVARHPDVHLTYCTNIHPGETWDEVRANIVTHVRAVKARVAPDRPFGVGLRLSAVASQTLADPETLAAFRDYLAAEGLYVFTINGFPYGPFHGTAVKERVYLPDWLDDERLVYSDRLARILAALLPRESGLEGSISTVPGCFRERGSLDAVGPAIAGRLVRHAVTLHRIREEQGVTITLALEPEPHCVVETTAEAVALFDRHIFALPAIDAFVAETGVDRARAEEALRRHLGVCFDACHAAVEFEDPAEAVGLLASRGIRILKIQVSAGLRVCAPDAGALAALSPFAEGVYLHQTVVRAAGELARFADLPEALAAGPRGDEWRVHFHVPLFRAELGRFENTHAFLAELLRLQAEKPLTQHLEIETYTWDVLPEEHRREPVVDAIAREVAWTLARLGAT